MTLPSPSPNFHLAPPYPATPHPHIPNISSSPSNCEECHPLPCFPLRNYRLLSYDSMVCSFLIYNLNCIICKLLYSVRLDLIIMFQLITVSLCFERLEHFRMAEHFPRCWTFYCVHIESTARLIYSWSNVKIPTLC